MTDSGILRRIVRSVQGVACAGVVVCAGPLGAQEFAAAPIALDIAPDGGDAPILVVALTTRAATPPVIAGLGGGPRLASLTAEGLPQPSIIIGRIEPGQEAAFGIETLLPESVAALAFGWRDLEAREALRARDPELFAQLVSEGHLDPPADELAVALQTDLARMNCYRSGIDGLWGPGSRRSVGEYFDQLGTDAPGVNATPAVYRAMMLGGDVACPTPVARQPAPAPVQTTTNRAPSSPPAAPAPQSVQPTFGLGSGVVR